MLQSPQISFIVATYGRAGVLRETLRSVRDQTVESWEAVVVGDCCDPATEAVVREFDDRRIRYYNLPARYGEQGGPNSVGLAVSHGRWISFLNHDDLLLPDHTHVVLQEGESRSVDAVCSRFVSVTDLGSIVDGVIEGEFREVFPFVRSRSEMLTRRSYCLEPASAWVIRREVAVATGPWRRWRSIQRVPFQDWMITMLRSGARVHFDCRVTGVYVLVHTRAEGRLYESPAVAHRLLVDAMTSMSAPDFRDLLAASGAMRMSRQEPLLRRRAEEMLALAVLRATGIDVVPVVRRRRGRDLSASADALLQRRTGDTVIDQERLSDYLRDPEALRVL